MLPIKQKKPNQRKQKSIETIVLFTKKKTIKKNNKNKTKKTWIKLCY